MILPTINTNYDTLVEKSRKFVCWIGSVAVMSFSWQDYNIFTNV